MSAATLSLIALVVAIIVSMFSEINVGFLSMALAFLVGTTAGGMTASQVIKLFPADLFMLLLGVSFLFTLANINGTLERITHVSLKAVRGNVAAMPFVFWILGFVISSIGPGAIPAVALLAPPAMAVAKQAKIPALLMATVLIHGTSAGTISPITPMGVIVGKLVAPIVGDVGMRLHWSLAAANLIIALVAYFSFGGLKLIAQAREARKNGTGTVMAGATAALKWETKHIATVLSVLALLVGAIWFKLDVGLTAILLAVLIGLINRQDETKAIKSMPWGTIMMVSGVMILIGIMGKAGGLDLIAKGVASVTNQWTAPPALGFVAGVISIYSSTTGVVLPAFLPMVPGVLKAVGGGSAIAMISSLVLTANVVDASPLSTLGALALAAAHPEEDKNKLFRNLMLWGIAMAFVGTIVGFILFVLLGL